MVETNISNLILFKIKNELMAYFTFKSKFNGELRRCAMV